MKKVRDGYKETEIGVIPEDWEVKKLGDLIDIRSGYSPVKFELCNSGRYPFFKVDDMNYTNKYLDRAKVYFNKSMFPLMEKGMVVFPKRGASIFTNKVAILSRDAFFDTNIMGLWANEKELSKEFLYYFLKNLGLEKFADITAIPQINNKHIVPLTIPIPPLPEQQRIAEILSTLDDHIEKLDRTIEDYELMKKGMMKKLLTEGIGHTEFKDTEIGRIPKEWEVVNLIDVADKSQINCFIDGDWIETEHIRDEGIRLIQTGNIGIGEFLEKDSKKFIDENSFNSLNCKEVKSGDILICRMAEPTGRSCIVPNLNSKMITSVDCVILRIDTREFHTQFINYFLNSSQSLKFCKLNEQGTTRKRITRKKLETLKVPFPKFVEQQTIASILSSIDKQISLTIDDCEDFIQLKKALMEQLLTGKIRTVETTA